MWRWKLAEKISHIHCVDVNVSPLEAEEMKDVRKSGNFRKE